MWMYMFSPRIKSTNYHLEARTSPYENPISGFLPSPYCLRHNTTTLSLAGLVPGRQKSAQDRYALNTGYVGWTSRNRDISLIGRSIEGTARSVHSIWTLDHESTALREPIYLQRIGYGDFVSTFGNFEVRGRA